MKPSNELGELSRTIESVQQVYSEAGTNLKIKLHSKMKALELLAKHLGMIVEKVEVSGTVGLEAMIVAEGTPEEGQ